ncbi:uncharacterized protein PHALS_00263 [Plasmopara halstedii]|uniref:Uncharacterized protein n=1 Tax=Plasmopara halstedii TaxID=4781 RepID=A0A0N7L3I1_PLAHL|nr:uncharacterized protein PHALS_00263 [Plasmopara halstedii]CEG35939.1 hypothetical protein PHALS_00263 [Plasmopara halstedii]|eukprot:XP_024572308.1 hypothetical protein PHALS_00263 [Plasmopara halstedii]
METPPSIRRQYASPPRELADQRRRRLTNRRAAKYRYFRSLNKASDPIAKLQRERNTQRQRERRSLLDDEARERLRAQNRRRQQLWRHKLSDRDRAETRQKQCERQRKRRRTLDNGAREVMRERARLRIRCRRREAEQQHQQQQILKPLLQPSVIEKDRLPELPTLRQHQEQQRQREMQSKLPFGDIFIFQVTLPPPPIERSRNFQHERIPSLPHLQQVTRPAASSLLHALSPPALFSIPGPMSTTSGLKGSATTNLPTVACAVVAAATRPPHPTPIVPSVSLPLPTRPLAGLPLGQQQQQPPRTPIVLPPAHRSLPPLPDFLSSREVFNPVTAAVSTRVARPCGTSRTLFPSTEIPASHTDTQDWDFLFQR